MALKRYHYFNHSYQIAGLAVESSSSYGVDPNWYTDTGATDHITGELDKITVHECYNSKNHVQTTNGTGLSILQRGHSVIQTAIKTLQLKNIICFPFVVQRINQFVMLASKARVINCLFLGHLVFPRHH